MEQYVHALRFENQVLLFSRLDLAEAVQRKMRKGYGEWWEIVPMKVHSDDLSGQIGS